MDLKSVDRKFAPTQNTAGYDKEIKAALAVKDRAILEYGHKYMMDRMTGKELVKDLEVVDNDAKLEEKKPKAYGRSSGWEKFQKVLDTYDDKLNRLTTWLNNFLDAHGAEEAATDTVKNTDEVIVNGRALHTQYALMHKVLSAISRKGKRENGFFDYGLEYHLKQCKTTMGKDLSKPAELKKLTTLHEKLKEFSAHFEAEVGPEGMEVGSEIVANYTLVLNDMAMKLGSGSEEMEKKQAEQKLNKEGEELLRTLKSAVKMGQDYLRKHNAEYCMREMQKFKDGRPGLTQYVDKVKKVTDAVEQLDADFEKLNKDVASQMQGKIVKENVRKVKSALKSAKDLENHHRNEEALQKLFETREIVVDLEEGEYAEEKEVVECLAEIKPALLEFEIKLMDKMTQRAADDAQRAAKSAINLAMSDLDHYRYEMALEKHTKAIDAQDVLLSNPAWAQLESVIAWSEEFEQKSADFQGLYAKMQKDKNTKEALRVAKSLQNSCDDMMNHHRHEDALVKLEALKEHVLEKVSGDPAISDHEDIGVYLETYPQWVYAFEDQYAQTVTAKAAKEEVREANSAYKRTLDHFEHHRYEDAMKSYYVYTERGIALQENEDYAYYGFEDVEQFVKDYPTNCEDFTKQYRETVTQRDADRAMREVRSPVNLAVSDLDHSRFEMCLEKIQKSKDLLNDNILNNETFMQLESVNEFIDEICDKVFEIEEKLAATLKEREIKEAKRTVNSHVKLAAGHLDHSRFEACLQSLDKARDALINATMVCEDGDEFVGSVEAEIGGLETRYMEVMSARRVKEGIRVLNSLHKETDDHLNHSRFDASLTSAEKSKEHAVSLESLQDSADIKSALENHETWLEAFNKQYTEIVTAREFKETSRAATSALNSAKDHLSHHRLEQSLETLYKSNELAAEVGGKFADVLPAEVKEFDTAFDADAKTVREQVVEATLGKKLGEQMREIKSAMGAADNALSHHTGKELHNLNKGNELTEALALDIAAGDFATSEKLGNDAKQCLSNFDAWKKTFTEQFQAQVLKKELGEVSRKIKSAKNNASSYLDHFRYEDALTALNNLRDTTAELAVNDMIGDMKETQDLLKDAAEWGKEFADKITAAISERESKNTMRKINSSYNSCVDHMSHNRNEQFLVVFNSLKEGLEAIDDDALKDFAAEMETKKETLHAEFAEKVFTKEIERKIGASNREFKLSLDHLEHHRHESFLKGIVKTKESVEELSCDDRFLSQEKVDTFVKDIYGRINDANKRFEQEMGDRQIATHKRNCNSLLKAIEGHMSHHRPEQALSSANKLGEALNAFDDDIDYEHPEHKFIAETTNKLNDLMREFTEKQFAKEVKSLIKVAESFFKQAQDHFSHYRYEDSLVSLDKAIEGGNVLSDEKYDALAAVEEFYTQWVPKINAFQDTYENTVNKRARDTAQRDASSKLNQAQQYFDKFVNEKALENLSAAKDAVEALADDFSKVEGTEEFVTKFNADADALGKAVSERMFGRECQQLISTVKTGQKNADRLFANYSYESSLQSFNDAQEAFAELVDDERFSSQESVIAYKAEYSEWSKAFGKTYAETVLMKEAQKLEREARSHLNQSKTFMARFAGEKALEELAAATESSSQLQEDDMFRGLALTQTLEADLNVVRKEFAESMMKKDLAKAIAASKKILVRVDKLVARGQKEQAHEAFIEARDAVEDFFPFGGKTGETNTPMVSLLPEYQAFVLVISAAAKSVGRKTLADDNSGSGKKKKSKDGQETIEDMIGSRYIKGVATSAKDLKLTVTQIGPKVHPKLFTDLKKINELHKIINKHMTQVFKGVKAAQWMEHPQVMIWGLVSYEIGTISKHFEVLNDRWLKNLQQIAPEDELVVELLAEHKDVKERWNTIRARWAALEAAAHERKSLLMSVKHCFEAGNIMEGCTGTMPAKINIAGPPKGVSSADMFASVSTVPDYDMGIEALRYVEETKRELQGLHDKYTTEDNNGFCNEKEIWERLEEAKKRLIRLHGQHCLRQVTRVQQKSSVFYFQSMRKWPLGRKYMRERIKQYNAYHSLRRWDWEDQYTEPDPAGEGEVKDAYEEQDDWYRSPADPISPAGPDAPTRNLLDATSDSTNWTDFHKASAGKIVFSKTRTHKNDAKVPAESKFKYGDEIYGRAYWKTALKNFAVGKDRKTGEYVYGDDEMVSGHWAPHFAEIMLFVTIDGKAVTREKQPYGSYSYFRVNGVSRKDTKPGSETDFWGYNTSCMLFIQEKVITDLSDDWNRVAAGFAYEFSKLSPGDHEVNVEIKYQARTTMDNVQANLGKVVEPSYDSLLSHPIAAGGFTINIPKGGAKQRRVFPQTKQGLGNNPGALEKEIFTTMVNSSGWGSRANKPEEILHVSVQSDFYVSATDTFKVTVTSNSIEWSKEKSQYARDFYAAVYRSPDAGWDHESIAIFDLAACTPRHRNPVAKLPPIAGIAVGRQLIRDMPVDWASPEELAIIKRRPNK